MVRLNGYQNYQTVIGKDKYVISKAMKTCNNIH